MNGNKIIASSKYAGEINL